MIRDLTKEFLPKGSLNYPIKVFNGKVLTDEIIQNDSVIFILNSEKFSQQELKVLFDYKACLIFYKTDVSTTEMSIEKHPITLLLNDKDVNKHLERIKGFQKNILELYIEKNKKWDIFGITVSYKQLFSIGETGFCFTEYPVIIEDAMNLDGIFIQEATKSIQPKDIIIKYLKIIENNYTTNLEKLNKRNAFQKVFKFYESENEKYEFDLDPENLAFLVDVLDLGSITGEYIKIATIIGALTSACSYFVHMGHPQSYNLIIDKLLTIGDEKVNYKHISEKELSFLKSKNSFLYYHLACRIPNQYTIALFDMFLTETDINLQQKYEDKINVMLQYLKKQISILSILHEHFLWEFKRDQEIGAMAGTIGQITLYKEAEMNGVFQAFNEAERYFKTAIEYSHPKEKNRDINYLIQCKLSTIVRSYSKDLEKISFETEIYEMSKLLAKRFLHSSEYDCFDIMFSICIVALSNVTLSSIKAEKFYAMLGFDWEKIHISMEEHSHQYATYLLVSYMIFLPPKLITNRVDIDILIKKAITFFRIDQAVYEPKSIIDLISLKFIVAHSWHLSNQVDAQQQELLKVYKMRIEDSLIFTKWREECLTFIDECILKKASAIKALQIIYSIPY